ncbi:hypothetical protein EJ06DRAFT_318863 [Trichodelitschia bisporula]|uniref:Uncharacterized protein n=1 Tax=Trichodelitschia bisporula TaxID=703511 RepID=A0A6G1I4T4_9PEZI|nr:hypothetical protein EJ06DRAFT_318863 [Trichodelitschia bisporula]
MHRFREFELEGRMPRAGMFVDGQVLHYPGRAGRGLRGRFAPLDGHFVDHGGVGRFAPLNDHFVDYGGVEYGGALVPALVSYCLYCPLLIIARRAFLFPHTTVASLSSTPPIPPRDFPILPTPLCHEGIVAFHAANCPAICHTDLALPPPRQQLLLEQNFSFPVRFRKDLTSRSVSPQTSSNRSWHTLGASGTKALNRSTTAQRRTLTRLAVQLQLLRRRIRPSPVILVPSTRANRIRICLVGPCLLSTVLPSFLGIPLATLRPIQLTMSLAPPRTTLVATQVATRADILAVIPSATPLTARVGFPTVLYLGRVGLVRRFTRTTSRLAIASVAVRTWLVTS